MTLDDSDGLDEAYGDGDWLRARIAFHEWFGRDPPDLHLRPWGQMSAPGAC